MILLRGVDDHVGRIRGGVEGAVRYLTRPFEPEDLRKEVQAVVGTPDRELRRRAAVDASEQLAALEGGGAGEAAPASARPRVARLRGPLRGPAPRVTARRSGVEQVCALSPRQDELVQAAAERLGASRSNVYASPRLARRLGVPTASESAVHARQGPGDGAA